MICGLSEHQKVAVARMSEIALQGLLAAVRGVNAGLKASLHGEDLCARRHALLIALSNALLMHVNYHQREHIPLIPESLADSIALFEAAKEVAELHTGMLKGSDREHNYACLFVKVEATGGK